MWLFLRTNWRWFLMSCQIWIIQCGSNSKCHLRCIANEKNRDIKEELILLQDKIKGIYIGSKQEEKELNLKEETGKKYNLLTRAIKEKRKVKILYYSYGKGENERIIDPAEMFLFQDGWYCAAFCELRKDIRHFELRRIIEYELLDAKYE